MRFLCVTHERNGLISEQHLLCDEQTFARPVGQKAQRIISRQDEG